MDKEPLKIRLDPIAVDINSLVSLNEVGFGYLKHTAGDGSNNDQNMSSNYDKSAKKVTPLPVSLTVATTGQPPGR